MVRQCPAKKQRKVEHYGLSGFTDEKPVYRATSLLNPPYGETLHMADSYEMGLYSDGELERLD
jgi:hypothetical protein